MTGFNRIELRLNAGFRLPLLCLGVFLLAQLALWWMPLDLQARLLSMLALSLVMPLLCLPLLYPHADDAVAGVEWYPDQGAMHLLSRSGHWSEVERICFSCSLPGVIQVMQVQRQDRALPVWLLITPEQISRTEARRLHVALRLAPPLVSRPATDS